MRTGFFGVEWNDQVPSEYLTGILGNDLGA